MCRWLNGWIKTETPDDVIYTCPQTGKAMVFNREDMRVRVLGSWENPGKRERQSEFMKAWWAARRRARA
jgi:hypothetical protein